MATTIQQIHPVAHLPLVLGVLRRLEVATVIDRLINPQLCSAWLEDVLWACAKISSRLIAPKCCCRQP